MELSEQLKKYRKQEGLTQKELALKLNVSDKTISSWKTGRTYPDISLLINLSSVLKISLDEFLKGDVGTVEKIDKDLKLKKIYKWIIVGVVGFIVALGILFGFLANYQYKNEAIDRINPLMHYETGYATLPSAEEMEKEHMKMPFKNKLVIDNAWGQASLLSFYGGLPPKNKTYAMVYHKGIYVKKMMFVSWNMIPKLYQNNMFKDYSDAHAYEKEIVKNGYEYKHQPFTFMNRDDQ